MQIVDFVHRHLYKYICWPPSLVGSCFCLVCVWVFVLYDDVAYVVSLPLLFVLLCLFVFDWRFLIIRFIIL